MEQSRQLLVQLLQVGQLGDRVGQLEHFGVVALRVDQHLLQVDEEVAMEQVSLQEDRNARHALLTTARIADTYEMYARVFKIEVFFSLVGVCIVAMVAHLEGQMCQILQRTLQLDCGLRTCIISQKGTEVYVLDSCGSLRQ